MSDGKRYRVVGLDSDGDLHTFETDEKSRAEGMLTVMRQDLQEAMIQDRGVREQRPAPSRPRSVDLQLDQFKQAACDLKTDDEPKRFKERLRLVEKHKPVEPESH